MTNAKKVARIPRWLSISLVAVPGLASIADACDMCGGVLGRDRAAVGAGMNASVYFLLALLALLGTSGFVLVRRFDREQAARSTPDGGTSAV